MTVLGQNKQNGPASETPAMKGGLVSVYQGWRAPGNMMVRDLRRRCFYKLDHRIYLGTT